MAPRLAAQGARVSCWARDRERAARVADPASLSELATCEVVWIAVADRAIGEAAQRLAEAGAPREGAVALHSSGCHGSGVLEPLARSGWQCGALHPMVSFPPGGGGGERLQGATFACSGTAAAREMAERLVLLFGGRLLSLGDAPADRARYHAAAALAANGLVALLDLALEALGEQGDREGLAHLIRGVAENLAATSTRDALTGPVVRGDAEVVRAHLAALPDEARRVYRLLSRRMVELARERGVAVEEIAGLLAEE